jgi:hypothetical protein
LHGVARRFPRAWAVTPFGLICGGRWHLRAVLALLASPDQRRADPYGPSGAAKSQGEVGERGPRTPRAPAQPTQGRVARRSRRTVVSRDDSDPAPLLTRCRRRVRIAILEPVATRPRRPGTVRERRAQGRPRQGERVRREARITGYGGEKGQDPHIMRHRGERISLCVSPRGTRS